MEALVSIEQEAQAALDSAQTLQDLEQVKVQYLGKQGALTALLKNLGQMDPAERPKAGQTINKAKQALLLAIDSQAKLLSQKALQEQLAKEKIDVTLDPRMAELGSLHPITQVIESISNFFMSYGFQKQKGQEIETPAYNFDALNIPKHHPARHEEDTFYFSPEHLLRTQTSSVQIHTMEKQQPPVQIIAPGRVYRPDSDATHTPMFHQIEGLWVDKGIHMGHLKGLLIAFLKDFFGEKIQTRFRPSYFPFTEPSMEVDVTCVQCQGKGCSVCKQTGFIEVLGCGMVHPNVLKKVSIDPEVYTGFAFGLGVERFAMTRYKLQDIRLFFDNDKRFLKQFRG